MVASPFLQDVEAIACGAVAHGQGHHSVLDTELVEAGVLRDADGVSSIIPPLSAQARALDWLAEQEADFVCIQDLRCSEYDLQDNKYFPADYNAYFLDDIDGKANGVAIYCRKLPKAIMTGLGFADFDMEGRYIQADYENLSVACLLLLAEPDFGGAIVLLATALVMLFVAGARIRDFVFFILAAVSAMTALAVMSPYRLKRLTGFMDPWSDPLDSGFQLIQSLIAIGRGEWFGVGLGNSVQKLFYLPEAHTDFIFAVLAEELGLLGVIFVLGLFLLLVTRIMVIGMMAHRKGRIFQGFVAYGIGLWIGLQALVNIGVNLGVLPTKGLTLPLISSGGSSMLMVLVAIGVVLRIKYELDRDFGVYEKSRKPVRRGAHKEAAA